MVSLALSADRFKFSQRIDRWLTQRVRQRRGLLKLPFTLEYRHIYVMPTRFGAWFGLLLVTTALGGLNFNNNMALLLGFLLAAIAQLTALLAYRNLVGLSLTSVHAKPVFAGEMARFRIYIKNQEARPRFSTSVKSATDSDSKDIGPGESVAFSLRQASQQRGWLEMEPFHLENRYPLGLFRAWSVMLPHVRCLVYPAPAANPPPLPRTGRGDAGTPQPGDGEHFHGLREYQPGDPLRQVAWRASARHETLYSKVMETPREEACELNWYLMGNRDAEEKLSILTAWILRAEHRHIPYALELPTDALPAGLGDEHRDACLKILALYGT